MSFLSRLHAELRSARLTHQGSTGTYTMGTHKSYARMERIQLPTPTTVTTPLSEAIVRRTSAKEGDAGSMITPETIGTLFGLSIARHHNSTRRLYPSGGALYPVETYLVSMHLGSQNGAVFHYNPTEHSLELLTELPPDFSLDTLARKPSDLDRSALVVFTGVWERSSSKYGDLAYIHTLIEAGHMSQNILLVATSLGIQARPYAGFNDEHLIRLLDLDSSDEQPIHTVTLCNPLPKGA